MLSERTKNYMTEEFGYWEYNYDTKKLTFKVTLLTNSTYGLSIRTAYSYAFSVTEGENGMVFKSESGILTKVKDADPTKEGQIYE